MFFRFFRNSETIVTPEEARELINSNEDILILDVRTIQEYSFGHIKNARLIPYNMLPIKIGDIEKYKNKPVLVYCQSGGRSPIAVRILEQNGFRHIYHLAGGFDSWTYEVERQGDRMTEK